MNNNKLKSCPFCGGKADFITWRYPGDFGVECKCCDAKMETSCDGKEDAVRVWNDRYFDWHYPKDELPPEKQAVFIKLRNKKFTVGFLSDTENNAWFSQSGKISNDNVEYWMFVPDFPERREDE